MRRINARCVQVEVVDERLQRVMVAVPWSASTLDGIAHAVHVVLDNRRHAEKVKPD